MTRAGSWKIALLIGCFAAVGAAYAADPGPAADAQTQAAKDKPKDKVTKTSVGADKDKAIKGTSSKTDNASKAAATTTALDPGLEVPSARNRPATAATPTTGTRGFPKKSSEPNDKPATDTTTATGTKPSTGK